MKSQVIIEQEKHIEEKKRDVDKLKKMNADIQNSFKDRELVESRLKSEIETLRSMLEASEKTIKDQKGMMQYLDKKLNDQQEMKIDTAYIPRFKPPPISNLQETVTILFKYFIEIIIRIASWRFAIFNIKQPCSI